MLSSDATEVVAQVRKNGFPEVWIHEVGRPVKRRVTFSGGTRPTWRPPGDHVTFSKGGDIWIAPADGRGEPRSCSTHHRAFRATLALNGAGMASTSWAQAAPLSSTCAKNQMVRAGTGLYSRAIAMTKSVQISLQMDGTSPTSPASQEGPKSTSDLFPRAAGKNRSRRTVEGSLAGKAIGRSSMSTMLER